MCFNPPLHTGLHIFVGDDAHIVPKKERLDQFGRALNDVSCSILAFKIRKPFLRFFELNVNFFAYLNCGIFIEFLD